MKIDYFIINFFFDLNFIKSKVNSNKTKYNNFD